MLQSAIAVVGVGKQVAKGTALANPLYGHGVTDGAVLNVSVEQALDDLTSGSRVGIGVNRTVVRAGLEFTSRVFAKSVGAWLYAAFGNWTATGVGPYTHTFTPSNGDLPYNTAFGKQDANVFSVRDYKVDEVKFSWTGTDPLKIAVNGVGTVLGFDGTFVPTTNDEYGTPMRPVGGVFSIDVDSAGGAAATSRVTGGEITFKNGLSEVLLSQSVVPDDNYPGRGEMDCSFDIQPDDLALWRTIVTGTPTGTTAGAVTLYGTFSAQFTDGVSTLTLAGAKVAFTCDFPSANPQGGAITISLDGIGVKPQAGEIVTVTLVNSVATY